MREIRALFQLRSMRITCRSTAPAARRRNEVVDYPRPWLERFSVKRYAHRDPVYHTAKKQALPFQWSDLRFRSSLEPDQLRILDEAVSLGLRDGFTTPIHSPGALFGVVFTCHRT